MRLLRRSPNGSLSLTKYDGDNVPPYAILSHTWGADEDEVTFADIRDGTGKSKAGHAKILFCAEQAEKDDLLHFWVDTCCINKNSDAELSESLNSMFRWYKRSSKCYVYLEDVSALKRGADGQSAAGWETLFRRSRWFTRGCGCSTGRTSACLGLSLTKSRVQGHCRSCSLQRTSSSGLATDTCSGLERLS